MLKGVRGFSVLEIIVVCVIVGILATLGLGSFSGSKEQAADREAQANLKLVSSAEKVFRMEIGQYTGCAGTTEVNENLRLMLPASNVNWKYKVTTNSPANTTFLATACRTSGKFINKAFCINETQENYTSTSCGSCP